MVYSEFNKVRLRYENPPEDTLAQYRYTYIQSKVKAHYARSKKTMCLSVT